MAPQQPAATPAPDISILGDQVTLHPSGYVSEQEEKESELVGHMARFRSSPLDFMREVSLYVSGTGWRAYDNIIGQPIYFPGFTEMITKETMSSQIFLKRIHLLADRRVDVEVQKGLLGAEPISSEKKENRREELVKELNDVAKGMVDAMICKMENKAFIRSAYYLATQLLTRAYNQGIHVSSEEVLRLRQVALECQEKKQSIFFLPNHKSHVDYVSLQLICYRLGIALPTVVAGDNLGFIGLKQFLQRAGAMWIRRSFAGDALYGAVVQSYIDTLLRLGYHLEAFVEGGRSRTGKLLPPKFGILSYVVDAVISGRVEDCIMVPVSTQYDKVIETEGYISELLGQPKKKENIYDFLNSSSVLSLQLGRVDVRFHKPWSLRGFIEDQRDRMTRLTPQISAAQIQDARANSSSEARQALIRRLGYRVLSDINAASVIMPTALVGTVLLTLRGRGVGIAELVRRVEWLSNRVAAAGGRVAHFAGRETRDVVERALEVLGKGLVGKIDGLPEDTYYAVDRFQLSFYRNMTIHLFIAEALVCASMYTRVKLGGGPDVQRISYEELYAQVAFLSQLFQHEFIYPTEGLTANLQNTLAGLEAADVIKVNRSGSEIHTVELADAERARGREDFDFYCFLIWPFIESNWLAAVSLVALTPPSPAQSDQWLSMKQAQDMTQLAGKTLYHQGDLSYYEAVNNQTLRNAYVRFEEERILLTAKGEKGPTCRLNPEWIPERDANGRVKTEGRLWGFVEAISKSRREGKNRRDGATVSGRVLNLADMMGRQLFEGASKVQGEEERKKVVELEEKRREGRLMGGRAKAVL